jgi:class 3 adenylate cyclase
MDRHEAGELAPADIYGAHLLDLQIQDKYHARYLTYWMDQERGHVFCLVDAPSKEAAQAVHSEAHGQIASEIIEVEQHKVADFLGRLIDPPGTSEAQPIADSAFRIVLFTDIEGSTRLTQKLGDEAAMVLVREHDTVVRSALREHGGSEVKHTGDGIMASFASPSRALESAVQIQRALAQYNQDNPDAVINVRIGLNAGEPVREQNDLFGHAVQLASRICNQAEPGQILASNVVRELVAGKGFLFGDRGTADLRGFEDPVRLYEVRWQD